MKHTAAKGIRMLCGMVVMLVLAAGMTAAPVSAASGGIYLADATPHYRHPVTGVIEDAGGDGSAVLGQSMTESALYRQALVEVDPRGNTFVTVRLKLMDNIREPQFQADGAAIDASLMQEDYTVNTADYRMRVDSEQSVIRCNMYVVPMGREVIFYITVSGLRSGSGDFLTTVSAGDVKPDGTKTTSQAQTTGRTSVPAGTTRPETSAAAAASAEATASSTVRSTKRTEQTEKQAPEGLLEFDENGSLVEDAESSGADRDGGRTAAAVLGGIAAALAAGGCIGYSFRKKR